MVGLVRPPTPPPTTPLTSLVAATWAQVERAVSYWFGAPRFLCRWLADTSDFRYARCRPMACPLAGLLFENSGIETHIYTGRLVDALAAVLGEAINQLRFLLFVVFTFDQKIRSRSISSRPQRT